MLLLQAREHLKNAGVQSQDADNEIINSLIVVFTQTFVNRLNENEKSDSSIGTSAASCCLSSSYSSSVILNDSDSEWDTHKEAKNSDCASAGKKRKSRGSTKNRQTSSVEYVGRIYSLVSCRGRYLKAGSNISEVNIRTGLRVGSKKKLKSLVHPKGSSSGSLQHDPAAGGCSEAQGNVYSEVPGRCQGEYASTYYTDVVAKSRALNLGNCRTKKIAQKRVKRAEVLKRLCLRWQHHHKRREVRSFLISCVTT